MDSPDFESAPSASPLPGLTEAHERFTGALSHKINNSLTFMSNYLYLLKNIVGGDDKSMKMLEKVDSGITQIRGLLFSLVDASAHTDEQALSVNITELMDSATKFFNKDLPALNIVLDIEPSSIYIRPLAVRRAILGLLENAKDFGATSIRIAGRRIPEGYCLEIADNGSGIAKGLMPRVFDPLFTTRSKDPNAPTQLGGLGLFTVACIIHGLGGAISCQSLENQGTRFRITLPSV